MKPISVSTVALLKVANHVRGISGFVMILTALSFQGYLPKRFGIFVGPRGISKMPLWLKMRLVKIDQAAWTGFMLVKVSIGKTLEFVVETISFAGIHQWH
jgi:hypothetical protein